MKEISDQYSSGPIPVKITKCTGYVAKEKTILCYMNKQLVHQSSQIPSTMFTIKGVREMVTGFKGV